MATSDWGDFLDNVIHLNTKTAPRQSNNAKHPTPDHPLVKGALERRLSELVAMPPKSGRNAALNSAAAYLGRFPIPRPQLRELLLDACQANGVLTEDGQRQCDATISSGFKKADADGPRTIEDRDPNVTEVNATQITPGAPTIGDELHPIWGSRPPIDGPEFLFGQSDNITALWGDGDNVLWAEGEAFMICGGMGLGKTTLAGQVLRAQLCGGADVLGLPVAPIGGTVLYLAMDRPRQIRRSLLRQFDASDQDALGSLKVRPGPPLADLAVNVTLLAAMAREADAKVVYIDSLKDAAIGLSDDKVGAAYNRARQHLLATGCQLCELHHNRKSIQGNTPGSIGEVYGSTWISAGAGSIVNLTGDPGDPIIDFRHVKQALNEVGPFRLAVDHDGGQMTIDHQVDLVDLAAAAGPDGLTADGAAANLFDTDKPDRAQQAKARRRLDKLVTSGRLERSDGKHGGISGRTKTVWFVANVHEEGKYGK